MKGKTKKNIVIGTVLLSVAVIIAIVLFLFNLKVKENLISSVSITLNEIMEQQANDFTSTLESEIGFIKTVANMLSLLPNETTGRENAIPIMDMIMKESPFSYMALSNANGEAVTHEGNYINISDRPYFRKMKQTGRYIVTNPIQSVVQELGTVVVISAPIIKNKEMAGSIIGYFKTDDLSKLLSASFNGKGYAYIVANDGYIIAKTTNAYSLSGNAENLFHDWEKTAVFNVEDGKLLHNIISDVYQNKTGQARYIIDGHSRLVSYATVKINDWNIFSIVPEETIAEASYEIMGMMSGMTVLFIFIFAVIGYVFIRLQKKHISELEFLAYVDENTGAPNLAKFKEEAQKLLNENPGTAYVIVKNDIDRFRLINQVFGFNEGNRVLCGVSEAFKSCAMFANGTYARMGTDEFILMMEYQDEEETERRRQIYFNIFNEFIGEGTEYKIVFRSGHHNIEKGIKRNIGNEIEKVNVAHKKARKINGQNFVLYDNTIIEEELYTQKIENEMNPALQHKEFKMFLQPKYYLSDEKIAGAEALVRWQKEDVFIPPMNFIPIFEQSGFVIKIDMYMFEEACVFIKDLIENNKSPIIVSVNFSRLHLYNPNFVKILCKIADKYKIPRKFLEIEITETAILENQDVMLSVLNQLHEAGFTLSMDDFGTGYSSLGLLKDIPVDVIKIDQGFFAITKQKKRGRIIISNVLKMAKELGIKTVAEGVETQEHIDFLRAYGCDIVQGYYYAKPMFSEKVKELVN